MPIPSYIIIILLLDMLIATSVSTLMPRTCTICVLMLIARRSWIIAHTLLHYSYSITRHVDGNKCQYSYAPDMYNLCPDAHSQEELDHCPDPLTL